MERLPGPTRHGAASPFVANRRRSVSDLVAESGSDFEQSIPGPRTESGRGESLLVEPTLQRVGTQVLLDDQDRSTCRRQAIEPAHEHGVQFSFADFDWRIAPDQIEADRLVDVVGRAHLEIRHGETTRVVDGEATGPLVHIDGDHTCLRSAAGQGERDRTGSASEIEERATLRWIGCVGEQVLRTGVESPVREDAAIAPEFEGVVGQHDRHRSRIRRRLGRVVEVVRHLASSLTGMTYEIRTFGDPVLAAKAAEVTDIDGKVVRIVEQMFDTLYETETGIGLAAPQVGIQRQIFVWDIEGEPEVIFNPVIAESDGEWTYEEGCLSIPGLYVEMVRPKTVLMTGVDIDGNDISFEADELEARLFQHELDHLNGVLMFDRMQPEQREQAIAEYRRLAAQADAAVAPRRLRAE